MFVFSHLLECLLVWVQSPQLYTLALSITIPHRTLLSAYAISRLRYDTFEYLEQFIHSNQLGARQVNQDGIWWTPQQAHKHRNPSARALFRQVEVSWL